MRDDLANDVRRALGDPRRVCDLLGLKTEQRGAAYCLISCPEHGDRKASCSVYVRDGAVKVNCHGCDFGGSVLDLVAAVHQLDIDTQFKEVLATAAELVGMREQADALREGREPNRPVRRPPPVASPPREYPPAGEVSRLWEQCIPVTKDRDVSATLTARKIDPELVVKHQLARALPENAHPSQLPEWARFKGPLPVSRPWSRTGHRLLVRAWDCNGELASVRAWRVSEDESLPKRVPPAGHKASELVLANGPAFGWLKGHRPRRIVVVEGEPDWVARSITNPDECIVGILSGSWHAGFAKRVPYGCEVVLRTHLDAAGDRYANTILESVAQRAVVRRLSA